ncbi:MAG: lytic transglycosylase domain-containing protein [Firmicutes bacterium]|nr:lytic transglycosylase domain-containing protein [Alicyclobacillaceae bacterium]MCL6496258.1 lytic transglycosylase domain-containing protein [Bacillota bacterium]
MAQLRQQQQALQQQMAALAGEIDRIAAQLDQLLSQYNQGYLSRRALYDAMLPLVEPIAAKFGLPPALVIAVITEESGGNQAARSVTGAIGLMQLEPGTAAELGIDPYNPEQNVLGGCLYLHQMLQLFHGNLSLALSAYNAGPGAVEANGDQVLPYTEAYVANVEALYALYQSYSG